MNSIMIKLKPEKIKSLNYLLSTVKEREEQFKIPRYCFLLGSGCSVTSNIPLAKGVIEICQKYAFVENHSDGYKIDKELKSKHSKYLSEVDKFISNNHEEEFV